MCDRGRRGQLAYWVSIKDVGEALGESQDGGGGGSGGSRNPHTHSLSHSSQAFDTAPHFCTTANLLSAAVYLSQELQGLGLGCALIETEGEQRINIVALVNALWEAMQLYRVSARDTSVLQDQQRRDTADLQHFQLSIKSLRVEVDERERLVCEAKEKERQATANNKTLTTKLKAEKEEVRRLNSIMQQRDGQYQHDLKKKELENDRLKDRLHHLMAGGGGVGRVGGAGGGGRSSDSRQATLTLSSSLTRGNRSRAKWKTEAAGARHEEDMYKRVLGQYEAWMSQLKDENAELKTTLLRLSANLYKIVDKYAKQMDVARQEADEEEEEEEAADKDKGKENIHTSITSSATFTVDNLDEEMTVNMQYSDFKDQMQQGLDDNLRMMGRMLDKATQRVEEEDKKEKKKKKKEEEEEKEKEEERKEEELEKLRRQLEEMKAELESHNFAVEKYNSGKKAVEKKKKKKEEVQEEEEEEEVVEISFVALGRHVEEEERLEKEWRRLAREREVMEGERKIFTEATIRLNRERATFEAEKSDLLKEQFLHDLPVTLEDDLTLVGHWQEQWHGQGQEVIGRSLAGGTLRELFASPQRLVAMPNITSPTGTVTHSPEAPLVLGPLPSNTTNTTNNTHTKQHHHHHHHHHHHQ